MYPVLPKITSNQPRLKIRYVERVFKLVSMAWVVIHKANKDKPVQTKNEYVWNVSSA